MNEQRTLVFSAGMNVPSYKWTLGNTKEGDELCGIGGGF